MRPALQESTKTKKVKARAWIVLRGRHIALQEQMIQAFAKIEILVIIQMLTLDLKRVNHVV